MAQTSGGVLVDLRNFLNGVSGVPSSASGSSRGRGSNEVDTTEVVKTATSLLKNFPAAREAVLYYFCQVVDESINLHLIQNQAQNADNPAIKKKLTEKHDAVSLIEEALSSLIKWNPKGWAPIISTWSLRLLGQMSSYHSSHLQLSHNSNNRLNETLQLWLACPGTRMLIDLTTQCLEDLTPSETGACINALLETSVEHSPHFDWVVAHIGGCFPHTVVTRVLSCGLQDFLLYSAEPGGGSVSSPKLHSVVGILSHLSFSHAVNIQRAVADLVVYSSTDMTESHVAVVPYVLQLCNLSQDLLDIILEQGVRTVSAETIQVFSQQAGIWCAKYFGGRETLMNFMVQQAVRCRQGGLLVVNTLLQHGSPSQPASAHPEVACELLEVLLNEAAQAVQNSGRVMPAEVPFIQSLQPHVSALCNLLLTEDSWQQGAVLRLLTLMALHQGPGVSNHVVALLLQKKGPERIVPLVRRFLKSVQGLHTQVVDTSIHEALTFQGRNLENALLNVLQLIRLDHPDSELRYKFHGALVANLDLFPGLFFQDGQIPHLAVRLLNSIRLPELIHPRLVAKLAYSSVPHFFTILSMRAAGGGNRKEIQKMLSTLSSYPNGQALILRLLMQGVFTDEWKSLFGAEKPANGNGRRLGDLKNNSSLLLQNRNFCSSVTLPQRHSSVFHAGIIGQGIRNRHPEEKSKSNSPVFSPEEIRAHIDLLLDTLSQCCSLNPGGMTQLSLLLVEIVSPDVMFNGLIWPDEEFTKVTVERDLHIRRFVQDHIVVWDLLNLLAQHRPALCYCSVLLRALLAILLSHWANCQEKLAKNSRDAMDMTCRLIELMATGQLLPPPLSYLSEVIAHVSPHEVHILLKDVWAFMRDNVPTPALFGSDRPSPALWRDLSEYRMAPCYTERLRLIMLANIDSLGHLYPRFLAPDHN